MLTFSLNRTGASGYIGGDVLHLIKTSHPEYECSILLRDSGKAAAISKVFPDVRVVLGDLDAAALIEEEASKADVVISKTFVIDIMPMCPHGIRAALYDANRSKMLLVTRT